MTKFLNISTDNTLGGSSPSDETVSSQKAIKDYVDTKDGNFVTLNTLQTLTSGKKIFANDAVMAGNQTALLATISNSSTYTTDSAWVGRYICGAKNLTFLMGTYRTMAGIGAHSWTNAQTGSGASWADFYLNPDGSNAVYIGGNLWTKNSGWMKIKNSGNASGTVEINRGTISSPTWKGVACWGDNVSKFVNDAGYTTNVGTVTSVNNTSPDSNGNVSLSIPTVNNPTITFTQGGTTKGAITLNQSGDQTIEFDAGGSGGGAVDSVNGQTGTVVLDAEDVGAVASNTAITGATKCKITYDSKGLVTSGADLSSGDITTALGYTPYSSSNPDGYTSNVGTVTSVNNVSPVNGNVSLTIPTVNNATLTIQKNGTTVKTFTANASSNVTCNITVPTDTSDLTNGAGYTTNVGTVTSVNNVSPVNGNVTLSIPSAVTESTVAGWGFTKNTGTVTSVNNVSPTNGNVSLTIPTVNNSTISFTQGGVSKGSFTLNQSSGATIALDAGGSNVDIDGKSITQNSSDELQTVGVIDQNATTTAIKTWTGTKSQYDTLVSGGTIDSNTLYNITDDTDITLNLLQTIYPVGSIYIGTMSVCPMASLFGTWALVAQDKVLQGAGTRGSVGTTINESLPNIVAGNLLHSDSADGSISGAIETTRSTDSNEAKFPNNNRAYATTGVRINASIGSSTYQDNAPVQPDAYLVNIWQRTA